MNDLRTAAQQALEALEDWDSPVALPAMVALRAALAEPVQEPVAYIHRQGNHWEVSERHLDEDEKARGWTEEPLYTTPPQRKPLTDEEIEMEWSLTPQDEKREGVYFARRIERAHGIGEGA